MVAFVGLLPLHTVFADAWIAWKPYLVLVVVVVALDLVATGGRWPYDVSLSVGAAGLVVSLAVGVVWTDDVERFLRLLMALGVGVAVLLVTEREVRTGGGPLVARSVVWSAAAMALTATAFSFVIVGGFGAGAIDAINDLPGVYRVGKAAYLDEGFVALTNWHQDPGYAAAWMNLWAVVVAALSVRNAATRRWWLDGMIIGGLGFGTLLTMSRSGWLGWVVGFGVFAAVMIFGGGVPARTVLRLGGVAALTAVLLLGAAWLVDRDGVGGDLDDQFAFRLEQNASLGTIDVPDNEAGPYDDPADIRANTWPFYWDAFTAQPIFGIGLGSGWAAPGIQEPHNLGLQLLGESGVVGALGFLLMMAVVLRRRSTMTGVAILVVALVPALFQTLLFEPSWWFAAGLYATAFGSGLKARADRADG